MAPNYSALKYSALESKRFGLRVFRAREFTLDSTEFVRNMIAAECDVAIVRLPVGVSKFAEEVAELGFPAVHADTLVYYECSLIESPFSIRPSEGVSIEHAIPEDDEELSALVNLVFRDYPSHYAANEVFDPALAAAGYAEWAINFIDSPGRLVLLARVQGQIVGFLTLEIREKTAEIVLNGVHPGWTGRGVYGSLVRAAQAYGSQQRADRIIVSTQIANMAVQRTWHREGFRLYEAYDTFHINALLHTGVQLHECHLDTSEDTSMRDISQAIQDSMRVDRDLIFQASRLEIVVLGRLTPGKLLLVMRSVPRTGSEPEHLVGRLRDAKDATVAIVRAEFKLFTPTEETPT